MIAQSSVASTTITGVEFVHREQLFVGEAFTSPLVGQPERIVSLAVTSKIETPDGSKHRFPKKGTRVEVRMTKDEFLATIARLQAYADTL
jgi:uncharacterized protein YxjI